MLDPADLLSSLGQGPLAVVSSMARTTETSMDPLLEALGAGASLEQLAQTLDKPLPKLAERLLQLELAGLVEAAPGLRWRPRQNGLLIS